MSINELRLLKHQVEGAILQIELGNIREMDDFDRQMMELNHGEGAALIGDFVVKRRNPQPARADEG